MTATSEFSITQLTRAYGVTPRAIRHYDEFGLIRPHRNSANRRRFDAAERDRLVFILRLRRASIGLPEIRSIMRAGRSDGAAAQLARAIAVVETRLRTLEETDAKPGSVEAATQLLTALRAEMNH